MKQTKRLMVTLLALLLVAAFALSACTPKCRHSFENGVCTLCGGKTVNVTIVLANGHDDEEMKVYEVNTKDYSIADTNSVAELLKAISKSFGEKKLFKCKIKGTALAQLGDLKGDVVTWNPYIAVFTTVDADKDLTEWGSTTTVLDTTLYSSCNGVLDMSLAEGAILYFVLVEASW